MGKHYGQLSIEGRTMMQTQLAIGIKPAAIALGLNRSASTLSHELRRNGWVGPRARRGPGQPPVAGGYRAEAVDNARVRTHSRLWWGQWGGSSVDFRWQRAALHPCRRTAARVPTPRC